MKQHCFAILTMCFVSPAHSQSIEVSPVTTIADYNISMPEGIAAVNVGTRWGFDKSSEGAGIAKFDGLSASYTLCEVGTKPVEVLNGITCVPRLIGDSDAFRTVTTVETVPEFKPTINVTIQDYAVIDDAPSIEVETFASELNSLTTEFQFAVPEADAIGVASVMWRQTHPNILDLGNGIELEQANPIKVVAKVICDPPNSNKNCELVLCPVGGEGPQPDAFEIEVAWMPDQFEGGFPKLQFEIAE